MDGIGILPLEEPSSLSSEKKASRHDTDDLLSVIVTTYNRPEALEAVLRGLSQQSDHGFEIIIADDGSGPETEVMVAKWRERFPVPLKHIRQCDKGFRAALARNRAVLDSVGNYLIFLDGDCIPRPQFIRRHRRIAEDGFFVAGDRVYLSKQLTDEILALGGRAETWSACRWTLLSIQWLVDRPSPLWYFPGQFWRRLDLRRTRGAVSCNLALFRDAFFAVDGFDARFEGWGAEDQDLSERLRRAGLRYKSGKRATGVLHLWHETKSDGIPEAHLRLLEEASSDGRIRAVVGLSSVADQP